MTGTTDNKHRNFKGQLSDEQIVCFTRKHWVRILPQLLFAMVLALGALVLPLITSQEALTEIFGQTGFFLVGSVTVGIYTYLIHYSFVRILNYYLRIFIITNQRLVDLKKTLFLSDRRLNIMLSEIQDISMQKTGLLQTIFNYGSLHIVISGNTPMKMIHHVPNPDYHFRKIVQARQEYITALATKPVQMHGSLQGTPIQTPQPIDTPPVAPTPIPYETPAAIGDPDANLLPLG